MDDHSIDSYNDAEPEILRVGMPWSIRIGIIALVFLACFAAATIAFLTKGAEKQSAITKPIVGYIGKGERKFTPPDRNTETYRAMGPRDAAVTIRIVYPFGTSCVARTLALAYVFAKEYPEDVRLELYDLKGPEGERLQGLHGVECSHVFVNGKYEFGVKDGKGKTHKVQFEGLEGDKYKVWDLYVVLQGMLRAKRPGIVVGTALPEDVLAQILSGDIRPFLLNNPFFPTSSPMDGPKILK